MAASLERRVNLLTFFVIVLVIFCGILAFMAFKRDGKASFDELTVKRINVVDESGRQLRLVISNENRQHPGRPNGKDLAARNRPAGILFFNNEGDEAGGLMYYANREGKQVNTGASLTMDQYHNDQVVQLTNDEFYDGSDSWIGRRGLAVNAIPLGLDLYNTMQKYDSIKKIPDSLLRTQALTRLRKTEAGATRLFVGRNELGEYGLFLFDSTGRYRFKIFLDTADNPQIQSVGMSGRSENWIKR